jgi:hypothetical protein
MMAGALTVYDSNKLLSAAMRAATTERPVKPFEGRRQQ